MAGTRPAMTERTAPAAAPFFSPLCRLITAGCAASSPKPLNQGVPRPADVHSPSLRLLDPAVFLQDLLAVGNAAIDRRRRFAGQQQRGAGHQHWGLALRVVYAGDQLVVDWPR